MDQIEIPILDGDTDLETALKTMLAEQKKAVVLDLPDNPRVIEADLVLHALNKGRKKTLKQVLPRIKSIDLLSFGSQISEQGYVPDDLRLQLEDKMDAKRALYALVKRISSDKALLLTRHEGHRNNIDYSQDIWACSSQNKKHYLLTRDLIGGLTCPHDGSICHPL